jgi:hypothetical protein
MRAAVGAGWRVVAAAFGLLVTSCAGFVLRQDVESARTSWEINPSSQRAMIYAAALHDAFEGRAYADQTAEFIRRANEALASLGAGESGGGPQLATAIGYRGLLLLDLGRNHEAWAELQRSMAVAPTLAATRGIVSVWGARKRSDKVGEACARTLPAMREPDSRFQLLELCVKNMHSPTEAAALAWAPPEALAFYRDERQRRDWAAQQAQMANDQAMQAAQMAVQQTQMANDQAMQAAQMANDQAVQAAQMAATPP